MLFFIILGAVMLLAVVVVGYLFYVESKEAAAASLSLSVEKSFQESTYQKQLAQLEEELQARLKAAKEQSQEASATIENLTKENEQLKSEHSTQMITAEANLTKAQESVESMRTEQSNLQNQLSESQTKANQLLTENQTLQRSLEAASTEIAKNFQDQINALKEENQTLKSTSDDLTIANQQLKDLNAPLVEKSEFLQWELTKARAQMTSLERACENYQHQLQDVSAHTGSIQEDRTILNETNNNLQSVVEDLQKQNQESTKREKLLEFELQKSRAQLISLERAYENLKANMNQSNPSS